MATKRSAVPVIVISVAKARSALTAAFEGRQIWSLGFSSIKDSFKKCVRFTSRVKSPEGRLRKIMRNIVENKGVFAP